MRVYWRQFWWSCCHAERCS